MHTLYICYFGLREPLVQSQVIPYLRELTKRGVGVSLLTFEPVPVAGWPVEQRERWQRKLREDGIEWRSLGYHKRPTLAATIYDILIGAVVAARWARASRAGVFHARAHIAMAMALLAKAMVGGATLFDIRGLVADEYVDAGLWVEQSFVYRLFKRFELFAIRRADQIVVLTQRMKDYLVEQKLSPAAKIEIIPCCVDLSRFASEAIQRTPPGRFTLVYAGSVTGLYLLEEMAKFFLALCERRKDAYFRILTSGRPEQAGKILLAIGVNPGDFEIRAASPEEIPRWLKDADAGVSFRKSTFSQIAASPTKIPEYLAAGLPVISNSGVGDSDEILLADRVGDLVRSFDRAEFDRAIFEMERLLADPGLAERCRESARSRFDLAQIGGARYRRVYERLQAGAKFQAEDVRPDIGYDREG